MTRTALAALFLSCGLVAPALAQQGPMTLTIRNHEFVPSELAVPAGTKVDLSVRNAQAVAAEFESSSLHRERIVPAGGTIHVFIGPLTAGRYEFFDDFHPATRGHIVVK